MRMIDNLNQKILVLGDSILDEYVEGTCTRISQEAPVPVLEVKGGSRYVLGGAGNTAANIRSLGGSPSLVTVLGGDLGGRVVLDLLTDAGISYTHLLDKRPTTTKIRVVAHGQQLLRMDYEETRNLSEELEKSVLGAFDRHIDRSKVVVLSDYAKGFFSPALLQLIIKECIKKGKTTIVDPKFINREGYKRASYITPNVKEMLELAPNYRDPIEGAIAFSNRYYCGVLLTRGEKGITLVRGGEHIADYPSQAQEVCDVSGAGDTVVAAFGLALAAGADEEEAIEFANKAAGVVVGKHGTSTVKLEEIK